MESLSNVLIDAVALVIVITVLLAGRSSPSPAREGNRIFHALLYLVGGVLLFDMPAWVLDGRIFPGARALCYTLDTLYYLCQIVYCYHWLLFSDNWNRSPDAPPSPHRWLYGLPMWVELAVILTNPFTGWIFCIGPDNVYVRGVYFLINLIPYYLYIIWSLALTFQGFLDAEEPERKRQSLSLVVFMLLPICGTVLETLFYGVSWTWPFTALSLLMVYFSVQQQQFTEQQMEILRRAEESAELKNQLTNSRVALMLSQMQPHFLYNALSSIKALCTRDPQLAAQASGDFAAFLRSNMDSLTNDKPVSFQQELEHTRHYLALEQIRFRDRLRIRYDIRAEQFTMPTLTLQPIVENAVRYGTMQRIEGGTVTIASLETADAYQVVVSDDGVGFDPREKKNDGRSHVGIQNVRDRLALLCGGTLTIESVPDKGTVATMSIPKQTAQGEPPC